MFVVKYWWVYITLLLQQLLTDKLCALTSCHLVTRVDLEPASQNADNDVTRQIVIICVSRGQSLIMTVHYCSVNLHNCCFSLWMSIFKPEQLFIVNNDSYNNSFTFSSLRKGTSHYATNMNMQVCIVVGSSY